MGADGRVSGETYCKGSARCEGRVENGTELRRLLIADHAQTGNLLAPGVEQDYAWGPNNWKAWSRARSSLSLAVTSACSSSICSMRAATPASLKV